jgi:hypothetical protein
VITDLDETIKQLLLIQKIPFKLSEDNICFDMPDREWASKSTKPRINFYLYDIRENHEFREYDWDIERKGNSKAIRKRAPIRVDLSYLVTVWTNAIKDEHLLLWYILATLFRHPVIPEDLLQGKLKGQNIKLSSQVAQPDGVLKNLADFWGAMENRLKPAINYVVTMPLDLEVQDEVGLVRSWRLDLKLKESEPVQGIVHYDGDPKHGIAGAKLFIKETGKTAYADEQGHFTFGTISPGMYSLLVSAPDGKGCKKVLTVPDKDYNIKIPDYEQQQGRRRR